MWFIKEYPWPIRGSPFPPLSTVPIHSKQIVGVRNEPDDFPHFKHHGWQDIWVKRRAHPTSSWHWLLVIFPYMKAIPTLAVQLSCGILCLNLGQLTQWGQHHQIIEPCYDIPSWFTWGWPTHVKSTNVYTCRWVIFLLVMHAWILWGTHWICHQQALFHVKTNITSSGYAWKIRGSSWTSKKNMWNYRSWWSTLWIFTHAGDLLRTHRAPALCRSEFVGFPHMRKLLWPARGHDAPPSATTVHRNPGRTNDSKEGDNFLPFAEEKDVDCKSRRAEVGPKQNQPWLPHNHVSKYRQGFRIHSHQTEVEIGSRWHHSLYDMEECKGTWRPSAIHM